MGRGTKVKVESTSEMYNKGPKSTVSLEKYYKFYTHTYTRTFVPIKIHENAAAANQFKSSKTFFFSLSLKKRYIKEGGEGNLHFKLRSSLSCL